MKIQSKNAPLFGLILTVFWVGVLPSTARAQGLAEMNAVMSGMDTLNETAPPSMGGGAGLNPVNRARETAGLPIPPGPVEDGSMDASTSESGYTEDMDMSVGAEEVIPKIKVITGTRIFDAITGDLLDDAQIKEVPATDKESYFDDGTNGDVEANDDQYTKVDINDDNYIGQSNQRVKERLVGALLAANQLNPLEFYGFNIMSTERHDSVSRNRAWRMVDDLGNGPGKVVIEMPIDEAQAVPKYRDKFQEKDQRVKDDWSNRFLQEYRTNKDDLTSEFYTLFIPLPPVPPSVRPPHSDHWIPYGDPMSLRDKIEEQKMASGRGRRNSAHAAGAQRGSNLAGSGMNGVAMMMNPASFGQASGRSSRGSSRR